MPISAKARGFTLTELAVVLVIVTLLISGMLMPLNSQKDLERRRETQVALESIREALIGYAIQNGRLPCPALATLASGSVGAGQEVTTGSGTTLACTATSGALPWATLGLSETDAWNRRYSYQISAVYARGTGDTISANYNCPPSVPQQPTTPPAAAAFALCSRGSINLYHSLGPPAVRLTSDYEVPALVMSHGANGTGAYLSDGTQIAGAAGDEAENADGDNNFVSHTSIDDQLVWISRPLLMNRMLSAGKLP